MASHLSLLICMVLHEWIIADVDDGTALKNLVCALKDLTSNNFGQAVLTLGCVGMGANFETIQSILGGCAMGVLYGHPMSGKTTVLKAALSVIGQNDVIQRKWFLSFLSLVSETCLTTGLYYREITRFFKQREDRPRLCLKKSVPLGWEGILGSLVLYVYGGSTWYSPEL